MDIHILDFVMYFVTIIILWYGMKIISNNQLTEEIGGCLGVMIILVYTVIYIYLFVWQEHNWIDIFNSTSKFINFNFKL